MSPCKNCGKVHTNIYGDWEWCIPCQTDDFKGNFTNWTSGNEKIDAFIQRMQLKIKGPRDTIFEWIPYDQFSDIKEIGRDSFATLYSLFSNSKGWSIILH